MKKFIRKYSLLSFYIYTFVFSFILLMLHFILPSVGNYSLSFTQFAPTLAVLFIAFMLNDQTIRKNITNQFQIEPISVKWLMIAISLPIICIISSSIVFSYISTDFIPWSGDFLFYVLNFIAIILGCIAEEIGWRGFLLPHLQIKFNPFISSILVGILWGIWHLNFTGGILGFTLYTLTIIEMSICMTWLFNKTHGNLWLMSIWHLSFNLASHLFLWGRFDVTLFVIEFIIFGILSIILLSLDWKTFSNLRNIERYRI